MTDNWSIACRTTWTTSWHLLNGGRSNRTSRTLRVHVHTGRAAGSRRACAGARRDDAGNGLWPAIAARVRETPQEVAWWENHRQTLRGKRVSLSVPQIVGIAAALVVATAAVVVLSRGTSPEGTVRSSNPVLSSRWPTSPIHNTTPQSPI